MHMFLLIYEKFLAIRHETSKLNSLFDRFLNFLKLLFYIINFPNKKGTRYENATSYKLMSYLFDGYKSSTRPVKHTKTTTNITFQLSILQIIDIVSLIKEEHLIFTKSQFSIYYCVLI